MLKGKTLWLLLPELVWIILLHLIIVLSHLLFERVCLCLHIYWRMSILNLIVFILSDSQREISNVLFVHHLLILENCLLLNIILVQLLVRVLYNLFLLELLIDLLLGSKLLLRIIIEILAVNVAVLVHHHLIIRISFDFCFL